MTQTPSYLEDRISQIPALRLLMALGCYYLTPTEALAARAGILPASSSKASSWTGWRPITASATKEPKHSRGPSFGFETIRCASLAARTIILTVMDRLICRIHRDSNFANGVDGDPADRRSFAQ